MTNIYHGSDHLRMEREEIDVTTSMPGPDPSWTYTDRQGHVHAWHDGWPTLVWIIDVEGNDERSDEGHWQCAICSEHVDPGMRPAPGYREFIPGLVSYSLNGEPIDQAEYRRLLSAWRDEDG